MRMLAWIGSAIACALLFSNMAAAEPRSYVLPEETAALRTGPAMEAAQNNCVSCHSADYISTQPPQLGSKFWEGVVTKMIKSFHAPISTTDTKAIVEYLSHSY